jgi:hypothetical protein
MAYSFPYYIYLHQQTSIDNMEAEKAAVPFCTAANNFCDRKVEDRWEKV